MVMHGYFPRDISILVVIKLKGIFFPYYFLNHSFKFVNLKDRQQEAKCYSRYLSLLSTPNQHNVISHTK